MTAFPEIDQSGILGASDGFHTAAPHYRRVLLQRLKRKPAHERPHKLAQAGPIGRAAGVNEGRGFVFVSHTGEIFPSGFLPVSGGNIRKDSLIDA